MVSCIPTLKVAQNEKEKNQLGGSGSLFSVAAFRRDSIYACSVPFKRTSGIAAGGTEAERFGSYYALISEDDDTLLWNSVYEGAKAEGEENWDACVEFFGGRLVSERTTGEKLRMAIDAGVDGIILNGDGSPEVEALVKEARQKGIPVVTALNDGAEDIRQCFGGVNSYNLGKEYAERIRGLHQEIHS